MAFAFTKHRIRLTSVSISIALSICVEPAIADIYKCTNPDGRIVFSDTNKGRNCKPLELPGGGYLEIRDSTPLPAKPRRWRFIFALPKDVVAYGIQTHSESATENFVDEANRERQGDKVIAWTLNNRLDGSGEVYHPKSTIRWTQFNCKLRTTRILKTFDFEALDGKGKLLSASKPIKPVDNKVYESTNGALEINAACGH